jgi:hypothetical protein
MDGLQIVQGLIARGYAPHQAAALAGHMLQESGGNPAAVNPDEGANGLMQWRLDRWDNLQKFAKDQGKSPTDPDVQLDYVGKELSGPEKKAGAGFLAAPDVASASAALKPFIRFGDDSAGTRLANANGLFSQINGGAAAPVGALASTAPAAPAVTPAAPPSLSGQVGALGKALTGKPEDFAPLQALQMPQANNGQSQQIAAALAKAYGIGA